MSSRVGRRTARSGTSPPKRAASSATTCVGVSRRHLAGGTVLGPAHDRGCLRPTARDAAGRSTSRTRPLAMTADAVGELLGLLEVVRRQQDRRAVGVQVADQVPELSPGLGVEAGGRLVEEQQLGPPTMPRATSSRRRWPPDRWRTRVFALLRQADRGDDLVGVARRGVVGREVLDDLLRRSELDGPGVLQDDADAAAPLLRGLGRVVAEDRDGRRRRGAGAPRGSRPSWSCRRRWDRAARTPRPVATSRSTRVDGPVRRAVLRGAVRAHQPAHGDRGGVARGTVASLPPRPGA